MRPTPSLLAGLVAAASLLTAAPGIAAPKERVPPPQCHGGHYGIVYPHNHGEEAPVVVVTETTPAPAPVTYQQPTPVVSYRPVPPSYGYSYGYTIYQPSVSAQVRRPFERVLEVGVRGTAGADENGDSLAGIGAYLRSHTGPLGFEVSIDSTASNTVGGAVEGRVPVLGAAMLYLNPRSALRVYGLAGGGVTFAQAGATTQDALTLQAGAGLDLDLTPRLSLTGDVRALSDVQAGASPQPARAITTPAAALPAAFGVGTLGISLKF